MKTEKVIKLVQGRLCKFNLDLETATVSTLLFGASVVVKLGTDASLLLIAYFTHAIHLCICDVLHR